MNEQIERTMQNQLMAMTELEAAALAMLDALDRAREAMRTAIEGGESST